MTPGNNGASTPEDDDPFGYLYADGQAAGATPPSGGGGYGYPGGSRSYNQVRTVGERQYGAPQAPQGQVPPQQQAYGANHYAAPETFPGAADGSRQGPPPAQYGQGAPGGRGRGGPNTKGLLIGAIAVVAAVLIGIGVAMATGDDGDEKGGQASGSSGQNEGPAESVEPKDPADDKDKDKPEAELPKEDAKALTLAGGTTTASEYEGAESAGGVYVAGLNNPGASATWTVDDIAAAGKYTLYVSYSVPGKDASTTLTVNGKSQTRPLNMKNFSGAKEGDWEKGWTRTFANVTLTKGTNTLKVSCEEGDKCEADLDQVWLVKGWPKS
ncbi:Carbohydrate binding module (family 6) [Streptomyces sp. YIM 130001]|uniref:carbohydrate-binding protein n=1 Tax=Streptomyces sp. YIM 130001 TaxID=2259644 RepID=UPI000E64AA36|nr:carbohydrate-binding protein [Streptomyces sp. YIM 130001]RII13733.1 Carbohydrate binding module (family 6) [Streptomyces sp. YIM 130001]